MAKTFTCDNCGKTFEAGWSEEEALAERDRLFSSLELAQGVAVLCDDCDQKFKAWLKQHPELRLQ
jgi:hypothetical protein